MIRCALENPDLGKMFTYLGRYHITHRNFSRVCALVKILYGRYHISPDLRQMLKHHEYDTYLGRYHISPDLGQILKHHEYDTYLHEYVLYDHDSMCAGEP